MKKLLKVKSHWIERELLYSSINDAFDNSTIIYLYAPFGFGKTIGIILWANKYNKKLKYISLEDTYNINDLKQIVNDTKEDEYLVFDDFEDFDEVLENEIMNMLEDVSFNVFIVSRKMLSSKFKLRFKDDISVITKSSLLFSTQDEELLLDNNKIKDNRASILLDLQKLNGWPFGVYAYLKTIQENNNTYNDSIYNTVISFTFDIFDEVYFNKWDVFRKNLFMKIGCFDELSIDQIISIEKDIVDKDKIIKILKEDSYFQEVSSNRFKVYYLFKEYIKNRQAKYYSNDELIKIYKEAGQVFEQENDKGIALECYLKANDIASIVKILEEISSNGVMQSRLWKFREYYNAIPEDEIKKSPSLCCAMVMLGVIFFKLDLSNKWLNYLEEQSKIASENEKKGIDSKLAYLSVAAPQIQSNNFITMMGNVAKVVSDKTLKMQKISLTGARPSTYNGGHDFSDFCNHIMIEAPIFDKIIVSLYGKDAVGTTDVGVAEWLYLQNKLPEALISIVKAIEKIENEGDITTLFAAVYIQIKIMIAKGEIESAKTTLNNIKEKIIAQKANFLLPNLYAIEALIALYCNDTNKVLAWLESTAPFEYRDICTLDRFQYFVKMRVYIAQNNHLFLIALAEKIRPILISFKRYIETCELEMLIAMSEYQNKNIEQAFNHLEICLKIQEERKLPRLLADEGTLMCALLNDYMNRRGRNRDLVNIIEQAKDMGLKYTDYLLLIDGEIVLTDNEEYILRLIDKGKTIKDIGLIVGMTQKVVKLNMANICDKFKVNRIDEAIKKAHEINML